MRRRVSSGPVLPCVRSAPWPRSWRVPSLLYETYVCHGGSMLKRLFTFVPALALPALLAAQTPKVAAPNEHASDVAKAKVAANMARRATHVRGEAVGLDNRPDRKSTRLNSSHVRISYAVFCLKKKKKKEITGSTNLVL